MLLPIYIGKRVGGRGREGYLQSSFQPHCLLCNWLYFISLHQKQKIGSSCQRAEALKRKVGEEVRHFQGCSLSFSRLLIAALNWLLRALKMKGNSQFRAANTTVFTGLRTYCKQCSLSIYIQVNAYLSLDLLSYVLNRLGSNYKRSVLFHQQLL